MELDASRVNVKGGAVSIDHPLGASGGGIIVTLINLLKANNVKYSAARYVMGDGASGMAIENVNP